MYKLIIGHHSAEEVWGRHRGSLSLDEAGSEVMSRTAAPMIGGMTSVSLLSMLVLPAAFLLLRRRAAGGPAEQKSGCATPDQRLI